MPITDSYNVLVGAVACFSRCLLCLFRLCRYATVNRTQAPCSRRGPWMIVGAYAQYVFGVWAAASGHLWLRAATPKLFTKKRIVLAPPRKFLKATALEPAPEQSFLRAVARFRFSKPHVTLGVFFDPGGFLDCWIQLDSQETIMHSNPFPKMTQGPLPPPLPELVVYGTEENKKQMAPPLTQGA